MSDGEILSVVWRRRWITQLLFVQLENNAPGGYGSCGRCGSRQRSWGGHALSLGLSGFTYVLRANKGSSAILISICNPQDESLSMQYYKIV